jgi:hypothetical protein
MLTPHEPIRPLLSLDTSELERAARDRRYPKWATMCLLQRLRLPVLNACHVTPGQPPTVLRTAIRMLAEAISADRLMLRSDGGTETTRYYRGGNTFDLDELEHRAAALLAAGRAAILLEPTNRFTNRLAVLLRLDRCSGGESGNGEFTIEALGPGYDVADLTRGGIAPQVVITMSGIDWIHYEEPWWRDLQIVRDLGVTAETVRRRRRLQRLAYVLADIGEIPDGSEHGADAAELWLREHSYLDLFVAHDPTMTVTNKARSWFTDAFLLAQAQPSRGWQCLATALSDIGDGRTVYWDLIDGARKYGIVSHQISAMATVTANGAPVAWRTA